MELAASLSDFPDRLSPVFVRDLRQGLRAHYFVWTFILVQAVAFLAVVMEWALVQFLGDMGGIPVFSGGLRLTLWVVFAILLPLSLFGTLQAELGQGRNIDLLLTSSLSRWQIVRGKLFVASTLSTLIVVSILPYLIIRHFFGGIELVETLLSLGSMLVINAAMNAIVIGSSGFRNYVGRAFLIFYLGVLMWISSSLTMVARLALGMGSTSGFGTFSFLLPALGWLFAMVLFVILGLQLGRSRLKAFENPVDPPATALVLIYAFCVPIAIEIATAAAGEVGALVTTAVLVALAILIDFNRESKKGLIVTAAEAPW